jgi:hypothetical protein
VPKYDVAISFLSRDEPIAATLYDALSAGLKVFFYSRNQEELAGTDGLESMRRPFMDDSRVSVVLYREQWGKTPWTRVEETAIKDGCFEHGWDRLFFTSLDAAAKLPVWLPKRTSALATQISESSNSSGQSRRACKSVAARSKSPMP